MNSLLQSNKGEVKTVDEWQAECEAFYASIKIDNHIVTDRWERYSRILGLQPVGTERSWSGRKPCRIRTEKIQKGGTVNSDTVLTDN